MCQLIFQFSSNDTWEPTRNCKSSSPAVTERSLRLQETGSHRTYQATGGSVAICTVGGAFFRNPQDHFLHPINQTESRLCANYIQRWRMKTEVFNISPKNIHLRSSKTIACSTPLIIRATWKLQGLNVIILPSAYWVEEREPAVPMDFPANCFFSRFQRHESYLRRYNFHWWTILSFQVKHFKTEQSEILSESSRLLLTKISYKEFYRWVKSS